MPSDSKHVKQFSKLVFMDICYPVMGKSEGLVFFLYFMLADPI